MELEDVREDRWQVLHEFGTKVSLGVKHTTLEWSNEVDPLYSGYLSRMDVEAHSGPFRATHSDSKETEVSNCTVLFRGQ